jgi:uncharacterized HAD superfamily protein
MKEKGYKKHSNKYYDVASRYMISKEESRKIIRIFNESSEIGFLEAFKDSVKYVNKIKEKGYNFHCITSLSDNLYSQKLRKINLKNLFGDCFEKFIFLDVSERKDKVLKTYANTGYYWVEDKLENALDGLEVGLKSILMKHEYSKNIENKKLIRVNNWAGVFELI